MSYNTETNKINIKNKKFLEKEIPKLSSNEHNEIFNIIRNNSSKYSENSRGVYINLKFLDENTINKMIEFIQYSKNNKIDSKNTDKNNNNKSTNNQDHNKFTLDPKHIHKELERLKHKKNDNFSFQNFLDKLSVTNIKEFSQNDTKINYPSLKNSKTKFNGVKARLLKKCRDVNKSYQETTYINNDIISNDESDESDDDMENSDNNEKEKLTNIIKTLSKNDNLESLSDDENDF